MIRAQQHFHLRVVLYQVEYAMEAISHAGACLGIQSSQGVVLAAEKRVTSKLLDSIVRTEKLYKIDDHVACAVAGITADANMLVHFARLAAQRYMYAYQQPMPVEQLVQRLCDQKQGYTQYGGLRPFGVSFLYAGYDKHYGLQLYQSDPSGNYGGWRAAAIGANNQTATSILKQDYRDDLTLAEALALAAKIMSKTMDSVTLNSEQLEFATVVLEGNEVKFHVLEAKEVDDLVKKAIAEADEAAEKEKKEKEKEASKK